MSAMVTWAPCSANIAAMPEPSPDTPPVMRAVLFFNFEISIYLSKSILPAMMPKAMNSNEPLSIQDMEYAKVSTTRTGQW